MNTLPKNLLNLFMLIGCSIFFSESALALPTVSLELQEKGELPDYFKGRILLGEEDVLCISLEDQQNKLKLPVPLIETVCVDSAGNFVSVPGRLDVIAEGDVDNLDVFLTAFPYYQAELPEGFLFGLNASFGPAIPCARTIELPSGRRIHTQCLGGSEVRREQLQSSSAEDIIMSIMSGYDAHSDQRASLHAFDLPRTLRDASVRKSEYLQIRAAGALFWRLISSGKTLARRLWRKARSQLLRAAEKARKALEKIKDRMRKLEDMYDDLERKRDDGLISDEEFDLATEQIEKTIEKLDQAWKRLEDKIGRIEFYDSWFS